MNATALQTTDLKTVGVVATIVLVVVGALLALLITKLIARVVILVVVVVLGVLVWQQRSHVQDEINKQCDRQTASYFGVSVDVPQSVRDTCHRQTQ